MHPFYSAAILQAAGGIRPSKEINNGPGLATFPKEIVAEIGPYKFIEGLQALRLL
jgi:hypothetical protein